MIDDGQWMMESSVQREGEKKDLLVVVWLVVGSLLVRSIEFLAPARRHAGG
jgi:hypothetical protein